jgi:YhcH/YjgK/YiaL family protein
MILSDIYNWDKEKPAFNKVFHKVVQYIRSHELKNFDPGTYEIEGKNLYVMIQDVVTVTPEERRAENHARYIDIQYLIEGEEVIKVARQNERNQPIDNQLDSNDVLFYDVVENEMTITMQPGMFIVLFPDDLHRASCSVKGGERIKKAVFKINKALLEN